MTSNENNDFVLRMQATLFTMTSLVLAFTLVEAESNFRTADLLVATEASQINRLDRLLSRYGDDSAADLRLHLLAYTKAIVDDEWPAMLRGERSEKGAPRPHAPVAGHLRYRAPARPRDGGLCRDSALFRPDRGVS